MEEVELLPMQKRFCEEYVRRGCRRIKESYVAAGYSEGGASAAAYNMLQKDQIKNYIKRLKRRSMVVSSGGEKVTYEDVVSRMTQIGMSHLADLYHGDGRPKTPDELTVEQRDLFGVTVADQIMALKALESMV